MKTRKHIPEEIKRRIKIEAGFQCTMPRCSHETGLEIHHIDEDPSNNNFENLILLCAVHHSQVTKGVIDRKTCLVLKEMLEPSQHCFSKRPRDLNSRLMLIQEKIKLIKNTSSLRHQCVGPFFLHPNWLHERRNSIIQSPNFDQILESFISQKCIKRSHEVRVIFRNTTRYIEKLKFHIKNEKDLNTFKLGILKNIDTVWGKDCSQGPDICCIDTGFIQIDSIFDEGAISAFRATPSTPVAKGTLICDPIDVQKNRERFDTVFDSVSRGQVNEVNSLRNFIEKLDTNF